MKRKVFILALIIAISPSLFSQSDITMNLSAEIGFTGVLKHEIQSGTTSDKGDIFNYRSQGISDTTKWTTPRRTVSLI